MDISVSLNNCDAEGINTLANSPAMRHSDLLGRPNDPVDTLHKVIATSSIRS